MEDDAEVASLYLHVLRNRVILLLFHVPVNHVSKKIIDIRTACITIGLQAIVNELVIFHKMHLNIMTLKGDVVFEINGN